MRRISIYKGYEGNEGNAAFWKGLARTLMDGYRIDKVSTPEIKAFQSLRKSLTRFSGAAETLKTPAGR